LNAARARDSAWLPGGDPKVRRGEVGDRPAGIGDGTDEEEPRCAETDLAGVPSPHCRSRSARSAFRARSSRCTSVACVAEGVLVLYKAARLAEGV